MREIYEHLRTMRTSCSIQSNDEYLRPQKVMRLYGQYGSKSVSATIRKIAAEIGIGEKETLEIIEAGLRSTRFVDYYQSYADEEAEETREEVAYDSSSETETLFFRLERANAVMDAFEHLDYRERAIVDAHLGFCMECYSVFSKGEPFIDIAIDHGLSSPDTSDKTFRRALGKMKEKLKKHGIYQA